MNVTFSLFTEPYFHDWNTEDYDSYLDTFFHVMEDDMFWMQSPYIEYYLVNEGDAGYDLNYREKSLLVQVSWDWSENN